MSHVQPADHEQHSARRTPYQNLPLAVSMGEPAGIGPDIVLLAWHQRAALGGLPPFVCFADPIATAKRARELCLEIPLAEIDHPRAADDLFTEALPVISTRLSAPVAPGRPEPVNAPAVITAIEAATRAVAGGHACAVVTAPIAKSVLTAAGFAHPGHTEFLGELATRYWAGSTPRPTMLLASRELRIIPLTVHIPIADVPRSITRTAILKTTRLFHRSLQEDFGISTPRIAIAGLNPHAGENGTIGREDIEIIAPAVAELRAEGLIVIGPLSADTMFHAVARATYDGAIAMYHDQALIPIKTIAFDTGVNVTLGLPFVRTSPDHGTALSIAGTGEANPSSFVEALRLAATMASRRAAAPAASDMP